MALKSFIYFDNNATTFMTQDIIEEMLKWVNKGNPSSSYASGVECQKKIREVKQYIADLCGISLQNYHIIINSGASEGNAYILKSVADGYYSKTKRIPEIIASEIEHKSIITCLDDMVDLGKITVTYIAPDKLGFIHAEDIESKISKDTALITIMSANNETGIINDIKKIGTMCHKHDIPIHVDCTQSFGKNPINPDKYNIDSFCFSFHKMHGPPGLGALIIRKKFYEGYKLKPLIAGTQNDDLRGGTENIFLISASHKALKYMFSSPENAQEYRMKKNQILMDKKEFMMKELSKHIPCKTLKEYWQELNSNIKYKNSVEIIFISGNTENYLCNTLLLSVIKRTDPPICNVVMKNMLEKYGIIVSVGSACNTKSKKASHVVSAMGMNSLLKKGILRISMSDQNTYDEIKKFIIYFLIVIKKCISDTCDLPPKK